MWASFRNIALFVSTAGCAVLLGLTSTTLENTAYFRSLASGNAPK